MADEKKGKLYHELVDLVKRVEHQCGHRFSSDDQFFDALHKFKDDLKLFKKLLKGVTAEQLDELQDGTDWYATLALGTADELGLMPDDPREFVKPRDLEGKTEKQLQGMMAKACIFNDIQGVKMIAELIDVNALDHNQQLALGYAVGSNHIECVRELLARGADPCQKEAWGNTAVHNCAQSVSSKEILHLLLDAGGQLDVPDDDGRTAMDFLKLLRRQSWLKR